MRLKKSHQLLFFLLFSLPIIFYFISVIKFSVNIPFADDYDVFFRYLNAPINERLTLLFSQHNEHRIFFTRFVSEVFFQLTRSINFSYLIYFGNLILVLILWLLYRIFKKLGVSLWFFLPLPYFLFTILSWENAIWATTAIQSYAVHLFALLSLFSFKGRGRVSFMKALFFAFLAVFSSGSGILIFSVLFLWGLLNIYYEKDPLQKRERRLKLISIFFFAILVMGGYFFHYTKTASHPGIMKALLNPIFSLKFSLIMMAGYMQDQFLGIVVGIVMLLAFLYLIYKKYFLKNAVVFYMLLFLFLNTFLAALTRSGLGLSQATSSRYVIISLLLLSLLYLAFLELKIRISLKLFTVMMILAMIFNFSAYVKLFFALSTRKDALITGIHNWQEMGFVKGLQYPSEGQETVSRLLKMAVEKGIYRLP